MPTTLIKKNKTVRFRITSTHYERLLNIIKAKGFSTISDYLRFVAFEKDLLFEMRFNEMYDTLKAMKNKGDKVKEVKSIKSNSDNEYLI